MCYLLVFAARNTRNELDERFSSVRKDSYAWRGEIVFSENKLDERPRFLSTHKWLEWSSVTMSMNLDLSHVNAKSNYKCQWAWTNIVPGTPL